MLMRYTQDVISFIRLHRLQKIAFRILEMNLDAVKTGANE